MREMRDMSLADCSHWVTRYDTEVVSKLNVKGWLNGAFEPLDKFRDCKPLKHTKRYGDKCKNRQEYKIVGFTTENNYTVIV